MEILFFRWPKVSSVWLFLFIVVICNWTLSVGHKECLPTYVTSSNHQEQGSIGLVQWCNSFTWLKVRLTTLSPIISHLLVTSIGLFTCMTLEHFFRNFQMKIFGKQEYFYGIQVATIKKLDHHIPKYFERNVFNSKTLDTLMDPNVLLAKLGESFSNPESYKQMVEKLNYLTLVWISHF